MENEISKWKRDWKIASLYLLGLAVVVGIIGYLYDHWKNLVDLEGLTFSSNWWWMIVVVMAVLVVLWRWLRGLLWIILILVVLAVVGLINNPQDRDAILNKLPTGFSSFDSGEKEKVVKQLSGVAENFRFCFREKAETKWECSYDGSKYMATMKEHIPGQKLQFTVCWSAGCSIYTSDVNSSTKGGFKNSATGSIGRWKLSSPEESGFIGTAIGTEGRGIGVEYDIRLQPLSL